MVCDIPLLAVISTPFSSFLSTATFITINKRKDNHQWFKLTTHQRINANPLGTRRKPDTMGEFKQLDERAMDDFRRYKSSASSSGGGGSSYGGGMRRYAVNRDTSATPYGDEQTQFQDEDEEVDFIKTRISKAKQDTLDSTRNTLRTLAQTEEVGINTLAKLGQQTEQLNKIDRTMEITNLQSENSIEQTSKLRTLNKSIFHVHVKNPFSGKKRREAELLKLQTEQERVRLAEERKTKNVYDSRSRINKYAYQENGPNKPTGKMTEGGHTMIANGSNLSNAERSRYTFEDEDPEIEDEINDNMNQMSSALGRLKELSLATKNELDAQDDPLKRIVNNTDATSDNVGLARFQLSKIK